MIFLTIVNSLIIFFLLFKTKVIKFSLKTEKTFWNNTLVAYNIKIGDKYFRIPIRDKKKAKIKEDIERLLKCDYQTKCENLRVKFSWMTTMKQVKEFEKYYSIVDEKTVKELVNNFKEKKK